LVISALLSTQRYPAFRNNLLQKSRQPIFGSPRQVFDRTRRQRPRYSPFDFVQGTLILRLQDRQQMHRAIVMLYLTHVLPDSPANSRRRMMSHLNSESFDLIARSFETGSFPHSLSARRLHWNSLASPACWPLPVAALPSMSLIPSPAGYLTSISLKVLAK